ncbi:hypothetical protein IV203_014064 [Nitzschia inconspicua]|uniref:Uncharacterized protein n=1 Tax=Nitzschia inconspicua TaxID=303405 RepID=A0A9K3QAI3_9STRA|nr:hypothetical protein IV203_014064 [Nitzschia inconspicua]
MSILSRGPRDNSEDGCRAFHYSLEDDYSQGNLGKIALQQKQQCPTLNPFRWHEVADKDQSPSLSSTKRRKRVQRNQEEELLSHNRRKSFYEKPECYSNSTAQTPKNDHRWETQSSQQEQQSLIVEGTLALRREQERCLDDIPTPPRRQESNPYLLFLKK